MNRVICNCGEPMKPKQIGTYWVELNGNNEPYAVWAADLLKCPTCSNHVVYTACEPIAFQLDEEVFLHYLKAARRNASTVWQKETPE